MIPYQPTRPKIFHNRLHSRAKNTAIHFRITVKINYKEKDSFIDGNEAKTAINPERITLFARMPYIRLR